MRTKCIERYTYHARNHLRVVRRERLLFDARKQAVDLLHRQRGRQISDNVVHEVLDRLVLLSHGERPQLGDVFVGQQPLGKEKLQNGRRATQHFDVRAFADVQNGVDNAQRKTMSIENTMPILP